MQDLNSWTRDWTTSPALEGVLTTRPPGRSFKFLFLREGFCEQRLYILFWCIWKHLPLLTVKGKKCTYLEQMPRSGVEFALKFLHCLYSLLLWSGTSIQETAHWAQSVAEVGVRCTFIEEKQICPWRTYPTWERITPVIWASLSPSFNPVEFQKVLFLYPPAQKIIYQFPHRIEGRAAKNTEFCLPSGFQPSKSATNTQSLSLSVSALNSGFIS